MRKIYIVKSARDFERIIKTGQLSKNKSFIVYYSDYNYPYYRYVISVGNKFGNAVYLYLY